MSLANDMRSVFEGGEGRTGFGLDFGTYRSMMAFCDGTNPVVPAYKDACLGGVPSLFWRTSSGEEYVGDQVFARDGLTSDPAGVCSSIKTRLHESEILLHGIRYTPSEIAERIIRRVMEVTGPLLEQEFIDMDFESIVCGVPVRFTAAEKGEIASIVKKATGGKEVHLVPEPILAALSVDYFMEKKARRPMNRPVLVFDMGAGTFDAVVLQPNPSPTVEDPYPYKALNPQGSKLAGDRMDAYMEQLLLDKLRRAPGMCLNTLEKEGHQDRITLRIEARKAKEKLSGCDEIDQLITDSAGGRAMLHITRQEYEQRILADVTKDVELAAQVVRDAGFWENADLDVVLVGGSTYIPLVRQLLLQTFDWLDDSHIQQRLPEKAVALGAAIYATLPEVVLPKVAYGYAVSTYNYTRGRDMLHVRIPSNATLPMTVTALYSTRFNNQRTVNFFVYEVDHGETNQFLEVNEGEVLRDAEQTYQIEHNFGRAVPAGTNVELTVTLDRSGRLTMKISDLGLSGRDTQMEVNLSSTVVS